MLNAKQRLCFALDVPTLDAAELVSERVAAEVGVLKIGLELFVQSGPAAVQRLERFGTPLFLDLKLHDIPATVERAVAVACGLGVTYLTLHASGGPRMLEAAQRRAQQENTGLCLLGVTVLTSMGADELPSIGVAASPAEQVLRLADCALGAGVGGLVCSVNELSALRTRFGASPVLVTPGIRGSGAATQDQTRVGTAADAVRAGSSLLVVGRPIRDAADPVAASRALVAEIAEAQRAASERTS